MGDTFFAHTQHALIIFLVHTQHALKIQNGEYQSASVSKKL